MSQVITTTEIDDKLKNIEIKNIIVLNYTSLSFMENHTNLMYSCPESDKAHDYLNVNMIDWNI